MDFNLDGVPSAASGSSQEVGKSIKRMNSVQQNRSSGGLNDLLKVLAAIAVIGTVINMFFDIADSFEK